MLVACGDGREGRVMIRSLAGPDQGVVRMEFPGVMSAGFSPTGDRIVVTVELGGTVEIRAFDVRTMQPAGRLRFATEP